jgi:hypothetical protein
MAGGETQGVSPELNPGNNAKKKKKKKEKKIPYISYFFFCINANQAHLFFYSFLYHIFRHILLHTLKSFDLPGNPLT